MNPETILNVNGVAVKVAPNPMNGGAMSASWGKMTTSIGLSWSKFDSEDAIKKDVLVRAEYLAKSEYWEPSFSREDFESLGLDPAIYDAGIKAREIRNAKRAKAAEKLRKAEKAAGLTVLGDLTDGGWVCVWVVAGEIKTDKLENLKNYKAETEDILEGYAKAVALLEKSEAEEVILISGICGNSGFMEAYEFETLEKALPWLLDSSRVCGDPMVITDFKSPSDFKLKKLSKAARGKLLLANKTLYGEEWGVDVVNRKVLIEKLSER